MVELAPEAVRYLPLVRSIAVHVKAKLPAHIELDDLVGYGSIGLMEALRSFKTGQGASFKTFAYYRIRGAMYDGLRKIGWLSRSAYAEHKFRQKANDLIESQTVSAENAVKRSLNAEAGDLKALMQDMVPVCLLSMEAVERLVQNRKSGTPEQELLEKQTRERLQSVLNTLEERERLLIRYYYFEDMTLDDAAKKLEISKSWASRLHLKVLAKLKNFLVTRRVA